MRVALLIKRCGKLAFCIGLGVASAVAAACQRQPQPALPADEADTPSSDGPTVSSNADAVTKAPVPGSAASSKASAGATTSASAAPEASRKAPSKKPSKTGAGKDSDLHFHDYE